MQREKIIDYLNNTIKYINLSAVCDLYNKTTGNKLDYNNLRVSIKKQSNTRVSDENLLSFINFLKSDFLKIAFEVESTNYSKLTKLKDQLDQNIDNFALTIKEDINNGIYGK